MDEKDVEIQKLREQLRAMTHDRDFVLERTKDSATLERCSFLNKHIAKLEDALMETAAIAFSEGLLSDSVYELIRNNPKLPMHMRELKNQ